MKRKEFSNNNDGRHRYSHPHAPATPPKNPSAHLTSCSRSVGLLGDPALKKICDYAAIRGSVRMLKWTRENNLVWSTDTCCYAVRNGHLPALKYLHENGCPWDWNTCCWAAQSKHWDCLQYAVDNKCRGGITTPRDTRSTSDEMSPLDRRLTCNEEFSNNNDGRHRSLILTSPRRPRRTRARTSPPAAGRRHPSTSPSPVPAPSQPSS